MQLSGGRKKELNQSLDDAEGIKNQGGCRKRWD